MTATTARNRHPKPSRRQMSDRRMLTGDIPAITATEEAGTLTTLSRAVDRGVITNDDRRDIARMLGIGGGE